MFEKKFLETTRGLKVPNVFCYNIRYGSTLNAVAGFDSEPRTEIWSEHFAYQETGGIDSDSDSGLSHIFKLIVSTSENTLKNIMRCCKAKLNRKTANFLLPSVAQKSHVLKFPINIFAQDILCLPLNKAP